MSELAQLASLEELEELYPHLTDGEKDEIDSLLHHPCGWPLFHISSPEREPVPYHLGQNLTHSADTRYVCMAAGTQSGKTSYGPWWMEREIRRMTTYDEKGNSFTNCSRL